MCLNKRYVETRHYFYEAKSSQREGSPHAAVEPQPSPKAKPVPADPVETAERIDHERKQEKIDAQGPNISQAEADQKRIDDAMADLKSVLDKFKNAGNGELSVSLIGLNNAQMELLADVFRASAKVGYAYIKKGVHDFERFSKEMNTAIGSMLKDATGWNDDDVKDFFKELWAYKTTDPESGERKKLSEWAEAGKKDITPDAEKQSERTVRENDLIVRIMDAQRRGDKLDIRALRKMAKEAGLKLADEDKDGIVDNDLHELAELAYVQNARKIIEEKGHTKEAYDEIVRMYSGQATVTKRDSDKIRLQQYSTPTPLSMIASLFGHANGRKPRSILEPSAGNGSLVIGFDNTKTDVNDIDPQRLDNLRRQGFRSVTSQDGNKPFRAKAYDTVVSNPPFNLVGEKLPVREVTVGSRRYKLTSLDQQMANIALESMKDDGRAVIIIGNHTKYGEKGVLKGKDMEFISYLYDGYNVADVVNIDGKLYGKNGTGYDIRMIFIDGRRKDVREQSYAPTKDKAKAEPVKSYDELYRRYEEIEKQLKEKKDDLQVPGTDDARHGDGLPAHEADTRRVAGSGDVAQGDRPDVRGGRGGRPAADVRPRADRKDDRADTGQVESEGDAGERGTEGRTGGGTPERDEAGRLAGSHGEEPGTPAGTGQPGLSGGGRGAEGDTHAAQPQPGGRGGTAEPDTAGDAAGKDAVGGLVKPDLATEKVDYSPASKSGSLGTKTPAKTAGDVKAALDKIRKEHGDIDEFVRERLGYANKNQLYKALGAEQIDSVAMAIYQMEHGQGFIIGDGTGVGKGRQAAALLVYGMRQGKTPIFVTQNPRLFADIYRDMVDIGQKSMFHPLIINARDKDVNITETDKNGKEKVIFPGLKSSKDIETILKNYRNGKQLPKGTTLVMLSYSQVNSGHTEFVNGEERQKNKRSGKFTSAENNGQMRRDFLELLAEDNIVILDESHMAAGAASGYFMKALDKAKGVTFLSGTFAKRPDSMPLYANKTIMGKGREKEAIGTMLDAIRRGGPVLQEIMSQALSKAGQMIRRERPTEGAVTNWVQNPDETYRAFEREASDKLTDIFRDMANFQRNHIEPFLNGVRDAVAAMQGQAKRRGSMGISTMNFASNTYNLVRQMSFALKAQHAADLAIKALKEGRKPVIAVSNTFETFLDDVPIGEETEAPDFSVTMERKLSSLLSYTRKNAGGESVKVEIPINKLPPEAQEEFRRIQQKIKDTSVGLSISPIDQMRWRLEEAGYTVGELTGRSTILERAADGKVKRRNKSGAEDNRKQLVRRFNETHHGEMVDNMEGIDVLILNKSAATGISLHSSAGFGNKDQREMILAQLEPDINDAIQMLGRVLRTGQVVPPVYTYLTSNIPAENRLLMMFKTKMKSLFANTTASQKAEGNEVDAVDMLNKYGDQVAFKWMVEHPDVVARMFDPLNWGLTGNETVEEMEARYQDVLADIDRMDNEGATMSKFMARLATLPVEEQTRIMEEVEEIYNNKIAELDAAGENTLVATELPLKAKTLSKKVLYDGTEPGGGNPFEDNVYAETVEVDVLKKPMTTNEITKLGEKMRDGKTHEEFISEKIAQIREKEQKAVDESNARVERNAENEAKKAKNAHIRGLKADRKAERNNLTDEEIEERGQYIYDQKKDEILSTKRQRERDIRNGFENFINYLTHFKPGEGLSIPDRSDTNPSDRFRPGVLVGFKFGKSLTPKSTQAIFATADGRVTVPVSMGDTRRLDQIIQGTNAFAQYARAIKLGENWDKYNKSTPTRERRTICTGNILNMLMADPNGNVVRYTTEDGEIKTGVLMPKDYEVQRRVPISGKESVIREKNAILKSSDGAVTIHNVSSGWGEDYQINVPYNRAEGGKYFLDEKLYGMMDRRNFFSTYDRKTMYATFNGDRLKDVLKRLDELGVTVSEEAKEVSEPLDASTEEGVQMHRVGSSRIPSLQSRGDVARWSYDMVGEMRRRRGVFDPIISRLLSKDDSKGRKVDVNKARQIGNRIQPLLFDIKTMYEAALRQTTDEGARAALRDLIERCDNTIEWYTRARSGDTTIFDMDEPLLHIADQKPGRVDSLRRTLRTKVVGIMRKAGLKVFDDETGRNILAQENARARMQRVSESDSGNISQGFGSAATSLNQIPSATRKIKWQEGTVNVDIGGGRFDKATEFLKEQGVENLVFDPFNRDAEHNQAVAERVRDEKADTVTCNNVLNVIDSESSRANVILQAAKALKEGGTAYFSVYEGDKSGVGRQTKSDSWQNNRPTKDYVKEIERYFDDVSVKNGVITARNPKPTEEQSVWDFDGTYSGNGIKFFRTKSGEAYGFVTKDGRIYIDPDIAGADTPIHEYTHLWARALRQTDMKAWQRIVKLMKKQKDLWEQVTKDYPDMKTDDEIADEVFAHYSGSRGEQRLLERARKAYGDDETRARSAIRSVKSAISSFWNKVAKMLGFRFTTANRVADTVLGDLLSGNNPTRDGADPLDTISRIAAERRAKETFSTTDKTIDEIKHGSPEERAILYSLKPSQYGDMTGEQMRIAYEERLRRNNRWAVWKEAYADHLDALKKLQQALTKKTKDVLDAHNIYDKMIAMSSVIAMQQQNLLHHHVKPFHDTLKAYVNTARDLGMKRKEAYQYVKEYFYTMSGLERNRILHIRDFIDKQRREYPTDYAALSPRARDIYDIKERGIAWGGLTPDEADRERKRILKESHEEWIAELQQEWYDTVKTARDDTFDGYLDRLDDFILSFDSKYDSTKNDRSGVNTLVGGFDSKGHFDEQALRDNVVDAFNNLDPHMKYELWDRVNDLNNQTNEKQYESGLIDRSYKRHLDQMMAFYLPMRKWAEDTAEDVYGYRDGDFANEPESRIVIRAKGRHSQADDPFATMLQLSNKAITTGEHNKAKNALLRLVNATYDTTDKKRLVSKSETWLERVGTDPAGHDIWELSEPPVRDGMTPDEIQDAVDSWLTDMQMKRASGDARIARGRLDVPYRFARSSHKNQHAVHLYANGKPVTLYINADPRAAMAINGSLSPGTDNPADRYWGKVTRNLSAMYTSWSPRFVLGNIFRDLNFGLWNTFAKEGVGYTARTYYQWMKNYGRFTLGGGAWGGYFKLYKEGKLDTSKKYQKYFKEFMDNGGKTGYTNNKRIDEYKSEILSAINTSNTRKAMKAVRYCTIGLMENINDRAENLLRFAAYCASREGTRKKPGKSILQSIKDAKDVSTNFNIKGAGFKSYVPGDTNSFWAGATAETVRHLYLFANPAIQSISLMSRNFKEHPVRSSVGMFGHTVMSAFWPAMMAYLAYEVYGEDENDPQTNYANLPEYERRSNVCFYLGKGKWAKIPLGIEPGAAWGLGQIFAAEFMPGNEELKSNLPPALDIASTLTALSPVDPLSSDGKNIAVSLAPSLAAPAVQAYLNTKWTGAPIEAPENDYNKGLPRHKRAYSSTPPYLVSLCRMLASVWAPEGADPDIETGPFDLSPGQMDVLIKGYFGGPGTLVSDIAAISSGETQMKRWPVVNRVVSETTDESEAIRIANAYRTECEKIEKAENQLKDYQKVDDKNDALLTARKTAFENKWAAKVEALKKVKKELKEPQDMFYHPANDDEKQEASRTMTDIKRQFLDYIGYWGKLSESRRGDDLDFSSSEKPLDADAILKGAGF